MRLRLIPVIASILLPFSLHASSITYTYTANPFTDVIVYGLPAPQVFTTSDFLTVSLTLSGPLDPNLPNTTLITPLSFSFSDGVDSGTSATSSSFQIGTDSAGAITGWDLFLIGGSTFSLESYFDTVNGGYDQAGNCPGSCTSFRFAEVLNSPGVWTISSDPVPAPEPSTLALAGSGFLALAGLARRRFTYR